MSTAWSPSEGNPVMKPLSREAMARVVAGEIPEGFYVNLGIGLPTTVSNYLPADREIVIHSENGILGMGPAPQPGFEDPDLINASKHLVTLVKGAALVHHNDAFVMIRGGHIDLAIMGAFQVSGHGDLANWATDNEDQAPAIGGAMDLAASARSVWAMMEHTTRDGTPRIMERCSYPLTAAGVVDRIFTNLAIIEVRPDGLVVTAMVNGLDLAGLQARTGAPLRLANDWTPLAT